MLGVALLWIMSFFPIRRQFLTVAMRFFSPSSCRTPAFRAASDTKVMLVGAVAAPKLPNIGRYSTGCGVGIEAFGSPMALQAMNPPLTIISGFTPKNAGFHRTRSASFPGSIDPISAAMPWVIAGLIVYLARERLARELSLPLDWQEYRPACL